MFHRSWNLHIDKSIDICLKMWGLHPQPNGLCPMGYIYFQSSPPPGSDVAASLFKMQCLFVRQVKSLTSAHKHTQTKAVWTGFHAASACLCQTLEENKWIIAVLITCWCSIFSTISSCGSIMVLSSDTAASRIMHRPCIYKVWKIEHWI